MSPGVCSNFGDIVCFAWWFQRRSRFKRYRTYAAVLKTKDGAQSSLLPREVEKKGKKERKKIHTAWAGIEPHEGSLSQQFRPKTGHPYHINIKIGIYLLI